MALSEELIEAFHVLVLYLSALVVTQCELALPLGLQHELPLACWLACVETSESVGPAMVEYWIKVTSANVNSSTTSVGLGCMTGTTDDFR